MGPHDCGALEMPCLPELFLLWEIVRLPPATPPPSPGPPQETAQPLRTLGGAKLFLALPSGNPKKVILSVRPHLLTYARFRVAN